MSLVAVLEQSSNYNYISQGWKFGTIVRVLANLSEDLSSVPSIRIGRFTTACNYSYMGSDTFFWSPKSLKQCMHIYTDIYTCTETHTYTYKSKYIFLKRAMHPIPGIVAHSIRAIILPNCGIFLTVMIIISTF